MIETMERRRAPRRCRVQGARVRDHQAQCEATVINVSPTGMLLSIAHPPGEVPVFTNRLFIHLENGARILQAHLVRESPAIQGDEDVLYLGCRFYRELKRNELAALGIEPPRRFLGWLRG